MRDVRGVFICEPVRRYALQIVAPTRTAPGVALGRTFVLPDDIKALAVPVLAHRMLVRPEAGSAAAIVRALLEEVRVPPEIEVPRRHA